MNKYTNTYTHNEIKCHSLNTDLPGQHFFGAHSRESYYFNPLTASLTLSNHCIFPGAGTGEADIRI